MVDCSGPNFKTPNMCRIVSFQNATINKMYARSFHLLGNSVHVTVENPHRCMCILDMCMLNPDISRPLCFPVSPTLVLWKATEAKTASGVIRLLWSQRVRLCVREGVCQHGTGREERSSVVWTTWFHFNRLGDKVTVTFPTYYHPLLLGLLFALSSACYWEQDSRSCTSLEEDNEKDPSRGS